MRRCMLLPIVMLLAPTAVAAWTSHGQFEPDTPYDAASVMFADTPPAGSARVYFNVYPTYSGTGINPNVALLQSRLGAAPALRFEAVLGVWTDCNGDGAIGMLDGALEEYPSAFLLSTAACPAADTGHNAGGTVREILTVGRGAGAPLRDDEALIWGDRGIPGEAGFETCRAFPLSRGTTSNTGRMLRAIDCASEHRAIGVVNTADNDGFLGLRIGDIHNPQNSDSRLVFDTPVSLFGNPFNGQAGVLQDDAPPAFVAWDCDAGEPTGPTLASDPLASSWWEGLEMVVDATAGDCDPSNSSPLTPFAPEVEAPFEPISHTGRDQNDVVFTYAAAPAPRASFQPWGTTLALMDLQGESAPMRWRAASDVLGMPPLLDRTKLQSAGAIHWTFYAYVGTQTLARGVELPSASTTVYGATACGDHDSGIHLGWQCDPAHWWRDPAGDTMPVDGDGMPWGARVGQSFYLRDVDCEDGELVGGTGLYAGATWLATQTCG